MAFFRLFVVHAYIRLSFQEIDSNQMLRGTAMKYFQLHSVGMNRHCYQIFIQRNACFQIRNIHFPESIMT